MAFGTAAVDGNTIDIDQLADPVDVGVDAEIVDASEFSGGDIWKVHDISRISLPLIVNRGMNFICLLLVASQAGSSPFERREPCRMRAL